MPSSASNEGFQPRAHWAPDTPGRRFAYRLRLLADLQTNTIHRDLRRELPGWRGRVLDIGCGNSPFRHLLDSTQVRYQGIDVETAASFGYANPDVIYYDGKTIPFDDGTFDAVLCTEVLEHVPEPGPFVAELQRVLKPGGRAIVTLPWSARFHYQPHDYHRYTPSMLARLFANFSRCSITPRGTDFTAIASKVVVAFVRNLLRLQPNGATDLLWVPLRLLAALLALPFLLVALLLGHTGILLGWGSTDDPLGYTLVLEK